MKFQNYATSLADKAKEQTERLHGTVRMAALSGMTTAMMVVPTLSAYASGEPAAGGENLLTGEVWTAITAGFGDMAVTCTQVLAIASVTGISIVGMTAAAKYAMKKIRGVLSSAA